MGGVVQEHEIIVRDMGRFNLFTFALHMHRPMLLLTTSTVVALTGSSQLPGQVSLDPPLSVSTRVASTPDSALASELAELLRETAGLPGLSVAAMRDQCVVFARGFGLRDVAGNMPVDSATQFGAASVSKVITATAALRLWANGRLDVDQPIGRAIPEFPGSDDGITVRTLAAHLSGIPHYGPGSMPTGERYSTARSALGVFAGARRVGAPGARSVYSTHGITLLSAAMEVASGQPILTVIANEVTGPLDMPNTGPLRREEPTASLSAQYRRGDGGAVPVVAPRDVSFSWAGAGLRSTPADLVRMSRAYFNGTITDAAQILAFTEQVTRDSSPTGIGFIWRVGSDWRGRRIAHHAGSSEGMRSLLMMFRDEQSSLALQTNIEWVSNVEETAMTLHEALFHSNRSVRGVRVSGRYAGTYGRDAAEGTWEIDGDRGWISTPEPIGAQLQRVRLRVPRFPIRAIRDGVYALVMPTGLYPMQITADSGRVSATVSIGSRVWTLESR
jgi:CubicO group peptidase (beta-lactamase class C family)